MIGTEFRGDPQIKLLYSISEGKCALGIGHTKIYELINNGFLKTVKIGASTKITGESLAHVAKHGTSRHPEASAARA